MPRPRSKPTSQIQADPEMKRRVELLRKVRTRRDAVRLNAGSVTGEAHMEYRWVNIRAERQLQFKAEGWTKVCNPDDDTVQTNFKQDDGTHVRGDVILYQIPKEEAEAMHADSVLRGIEYIESAQQDFVDMADTRGVPTFTPQR